MSDMDLHVNIEGEMSIDETSAKKIGRVFWNLMKHWQMSPAEQALLLGVKYHATKLKGWRAQNIIPQDPDKFIRVGQLIGIHKNLRILFPYNRRAAYNFMKTPQKFLFNNKAPIEIIKAGGEIYSYANIAAIRRRLDQARV